MGHKLYIKNMVCPRCIDTVLKIFDELDVNVSSIQLGEVIINKEPDKHFFELLNEKLTSRGFELLEDQKSKLINQIKSLIIQEIHHSKEILNINYSLLLSQKLNHDYSYLSRLFSSVEGITIEKFILSQKIEKVKELIFYNELTIAQIADQMHYSSPAHLSSQFKKETGMTPSEFKKQRKPGHRSLDTL